MSEEYIKRSDALKAIKHYCQDCNSYNGVMCRACGYGDSIDAVDDVPAADVAQVVHGRWQTEYGGGRIVTYAVGQRAIYAHIYCSACGEEALQGPLEESIASKYCPNCGARMDLEVETDAAD